MLMRRGVQVKKAHLIIDVIYTAILTVAIFLHFFPQPFLPNWFYVFNWLVVVLILVSALLYKKVNPTEQENERYSFFIGLYILTLLILFTLIGGKSSSQGAPLDHPIVWIIFAVWLFFVWKRIHKESND